MARFYHVYRTFLKKNSKSSKQPLLVEGKNDEKNRDAL